MRSLNGLDEFDVLSQSITENIETIKAVESSLDVFQNSLTSIGGSVSTITSRVDTLEGSVGTLDTRVDTLEGSVGTLETSVTTLGGSVGTLEGSVGTLEDKIANLDFADVGGTLQNDQVADVGLSAGKIEFNESVFNYPPTSIGKYAIQLRDQITNLQFSDLNGNLNEDQVADASLGAEKVSFDLQTIYPVDTIGNSLVSLDNRISSLNFTDLSGTINDAQISDTSVGASKIYFPTGNYPFISEYPENSVAYQLDWEANSWWSVIGDAQQAISIATMINSLYQSQVNGITVASLNARLTALDFPDLGPLQGKVPILEHNMNTIFAKTAGIERVEVDGSFITKIEGENLNYEVSTLKQTTNGITYIGDSEITSIEGTLNADIITNPELQGATSKLQNITATPQVTNVSGLLNADEITTDTLAFGDPPTYLADLKGKITDINYDTVNLKTTIANTLSAEVYENLPPYPDLSALEQKTTGISYLNGHTTITGNTNAQFDFLRLTNMETRDLPPTDNNYVNLGFDRNIGTQADRPAFFYKDHDDQSIAYLIDTHNAGYLDGYQFPTSVIPNLDASKITTGTFSVNRIPNLDASKITGNQLSLNGGVLGTIQTDAILNLSMNSVDGWRIYSDASNSFNFKIEERLLGIRRFQINKNGLITMNVGRGDVYFEDNSNDDLDGTGLTIRTSVNPSNGSMFAVRSSGQAGRLWVGQSATSVGYNSFYAGVYTGSSGGEGTAGNFSFRVDSGSGNLDMTNGIINARKNTDTTHFFGRGYIGYDGINTDSATFGHVDYQNALDYCLRQDVDGYTRLNSGASYIYFSIRTNLTNRIYWDSSTSTTRFYIYGYPAAAYSSTLRTTSNATGYICRQTSSRDTKQDIEDLWDSMVDNVIDNLRPVWFRYKPEIQTSYDYQKDWSDVGLIAEEVFEVEPKLAHLDENRKPHDVAYDKIGVWCLSYIKRQKKQIADLVAKNQELEAKIEGILSRLDGSV